MRRLRVHSLAAASALTLLAFAGCSTLTPSQRAELIQQATSEESWVRLSAVYELAKYRDAECRAALYRLATDPDPSIRGHVIHELGQSGDKQACPILVEALRDRESWKHCRQEFFIMFTLCMEPIAATANDALQRITWHRVKFDADAPLTEREAAIREWRRYLKLPETVPMTMPSANNPPPLPGRNASWGGHRNQGFRCAPPLANDPGPFGANIGAMAASGNQFSVPHGQFSVLTSQFSVPGSQFSILNSQFSVLSGKASLASPANGSHFSLLTSHFAPRRGGASCL